MLSFLLFYSIFYSDRIGPSWWFEEQQVLFGLGVSLQKIEVYSFVFLIYKSFVAVIKQNQKNENLMIYKFNEFVSYSK